MMLADYLSSNGFIKTNKIMIKAVGTDAAIIIGELCAKYIFWEEKGALKDGEWFYFTRKDIEGETGLSAHKQRVAIDKLVKKNLITAKRMGIPCKTYYKLNEADIIECYNETRKKALNKAKKSVVENLDNSTSNFETPSDEINEQQADENLDINKNNNKNNNKNKEIHTHELSPIEEKKEYATQVQMTEKEYKDLVDTYGEDMTKQLIEQLSLYKQAKGKNYESDYAAILYWVTERLRELEKKDANYKDFKERKDKKNEY